MGCQDLRIAGIPRAGRYTLGSWISYSIGLPLRRLQQRTSLASQEWVSGLGFGPRDEGIKAPKSSCDV